MAVSFFLAPNGGIVFYVLCLLRLVVVAVVVEGTHL